jgi:ADP-ribosylglycohydrolase/fructose-1,6-bisphosphatase/inositol monophosphatase family enzyme
MTRGQPDWVSASREASRYAAELALATSLAQQAGRLIREEFHRAGGPRHSGPSHADVDTEAERLILAGLRGTWPDDVVAAEETASSANRRAERLWLVDPHDGTRAFIEGHRGSAVSIALVVNGELVLGVVYAPTAPDDAGDLITWAVGEPLRRNGEAVQRSPLPGTLDGLSIVALNADARGEKLGAALAFTAPARLLSRASIAYRLALVAVGEADAAISTSGPTDWDVAAGHALLLPVGGVLLDARAKPVRYGAASTGATDVFGGHPDVAAELAERARRSKRLELPAAKVAKSYPHVSPRHGLHVRDEAVLARAHGALLGQVAGDALGQLVEFQSRSAVAKKYPYGVRDLVDGGSWNTLAGQPTDDSELALMLARSIVVEGRFTPDAAQRAYEAWLESRPFDVGTTTRRGIQGQDTGDSESNGSAMRISPLAVHLWRSVPDGVASYAVQDAQLTHSSETCIEATAVLAVAIAMAVREGLQPRALFEKVAAWVRGNELFHTMVRALFEGDDVKPVTDFQHNQGWVLIALRNAFHQLLHAPSFEEGVVRTVDQGGDADTNGAIAGALLGAVYGREAVPLRWRRAVLTCRAVSGAHPRPAPFWADDLLELAERLVALGPEVAVVDDAERGRVVSLAQRRGHVAAEGEARARLRRAALDAVPALQQAASELALFAGLPAPESDEQKGVSGLTRSLVGCKDGDVAAVGEALRLLETVGRKE